MAFVQRICRLDVAKRMLVAAALLGGTSTSIAQNVPTRESELNSFADFLASVSMIEDDTTVPASPLPAPLQSDDQAEPSRRDVVEQEKEDSAAAVARSVQSNKDSQSTQEDPASLDYPSEDDLTLADVIASMLRAYPEIAIARQEQTRTDGELLSAFGAYDTKLQAYTLNEPIGFYENHRHGIGVSRQTWWGGYVGAGYRTGRGNFQPWYKERETDKAGELKLGLGLPLLQGRAIDPQRLAVFQASLSRQAVQPTVQQAILESARDAADAYWQWVAAGLFLQAQRELLELAIARGEQFDIGFQAGMFAEIDVVLNRQLIAERRAKVLEAEQKFRVSGFKLSMFLRDEQGRPLVPDDQWLPDRFPIVEPPRDANFQDDLMAALQRRPEPRVLLLEMRQIELERRLARNQLLPQLDVIAEASQDMGDPASSSNDKGDFELLLGLAAEVPIQRRSARGKITSASAKIAQVSEKLRLQQNKIGVELQTAYNAMTQAALIVDQTELSLEAAFESLRRYRFAFDRGKVDLIYLNLLETKANETEIKLIEAQQSWFNAIAEMQIALGLDPLDSAVAVSSLPLSSRPGPGRLPEEIKIDEKDLEKDWELHSDR